jgi:hypothetical protein
MSRGDVCARCEHFTLDGGKPAEGIGRCLGYGENPVEPLVRWDHGFCVLFGAAPDLQKRRAWIAKREREECGNVPAAA